LQQRLCVERRYWVTYKSVFCRNAVLSLPASEGNGRTTQLGTTADASLALTMSSLRALQLGAQLAADMRHIESVEWTLRCRMAADGASSEGAQAAFSRLASLPRLRSLTVRDGSTGAVAVRQRAFAAASAYVAQMPSLTSLVLASQPKCRPAVAALARDLAPLRQLACLELTRCGFHDPCVAQDVARALRCLGALTSVRMRHNRIADAAAPHVAAGIAACGGLLTLDLSYNRLWDRNAAVVASGFSALTRLQTLDVSGNAARRGVWVYVASVPLPTLQSLHLSDMQLHEGADQLPSAPHVSAVQRLALSLQGQTSLRSVSYCNGPSASAFSLVLRLPGLAHLQNLELGGFGRAHYMPAISGAEHVWLGFTSECLAGCLANVLPQLAQLSRLSLSEHRLHTREAHIVGPASAALPRLRVLHIDGGRSSAPRLRRAHASLAFLQHFAHDGVPAREELSIGQDPTFLRQAQRQAGTHLAALTSLQHLALANTGLVNRGLALLAAPGAPDSAQRAQLRQQSHWQHRSRHSARSEGCTRWWSCGKLAHRL
jgi:hypothetical protein